MFRITRTAILDEHLQKVGDIVVTVALIERISFTTGQVANLYLVDLAIEPWVQQTFGATIGDRRPSPSRKTRRSRARREASEISHWPVVLEQHDSYRVAEKTASDSLRENRIFAGAMNRLIAAVVGSRFASTPHPIRGCDRKLAECPVPCAKTILMHSG